MTNRDALLKAIEIVKEYGRGGNDSYEPEELLEKLYKKIVELGENH